MIHPVMSLFLLLLVPETLAIPSLPYDNFESGIYSLKDGQTSPNTMWQNIYNGGGLSGVTYEGISNNKVFFLYSATAKSVNETYSNLVMSTKNFSDFELSADVKTVRQLRQNSQPNAWEAATIFFRWAGTFHYYWFTIKVNGIELGKKDCNTCTDTKQGQQFLFTASTPVLKIGSWSNWNIKTHDNHITISVNGSKLIDFVDEKMSTNLDTGKIAMYVEDASAYFDNVYITPK
jgi:hypothetical protein